MNISSAVTETTKAVGCGVSVVYSVCKEKEKCSLVSPGRKKPKRANNQKNCRLETFDENTQMLIRRKVHSFFFKNIPPTLNIIFSSVSDDTDIPNFTRTTLYRLLIGMGFIYEKVGKRMMLIERDDIMTRCVKEAYRLLNKSIIRVEQPDIHLDENNEPMMDDEEPETQVNGEVETQPKRKLVLSFEEYKTLSNMIVMHMRKEETKVEEGEQGGMHRSDVVEWYLNTIVDQIESEDNLLEKKQLIEKVIDRLIYHDQVIIPLTKVGLKGDQQDEEEDPLLVVRPNYIIDQ